MEDGNAMRATLAELGLTQGALARHMKELGDDRDEKNILRSIQRMIAGDARVSGEMRALLGAIPRQPKALIITLTEDEAQEIRGAVGSGGHQSLHRRLTSELARGLEVSFSDEQLGELIRYMTRYGSGGFQSRLRRAFKRPLEELLGMQFR